MNGTEEDWRQWLRQVTERVRSMGRATPASASTPLPAFAGEELAELLHELGQLDTRHREANQEMVREARQRMAHLQELHNANRMVTVGTLTAGMAHEFGTPLGVVLARAQMIVADDSDLTEARKDAEVIVQQVKRMTRMCREVLDFARPRAPAREALDMVQIVRQSMLLLLPDARQRKAQLKLDGNPPPSWVLGDASKLTQILTNLVINAAQAMPDGGPITLSVETQHVKSPGVEGRGEADYVCVHVQDRGTGIGEADLEHIFETFFTTKKHGEGTGLGLAVSSRIALAHDGWIGVVTEVGLGSRFTVYLPSAPPP